MILSKNYDFTYDIIVFWQYHIWYHNSVGFLAFLALFFCDIAYDIIYTLYEISYDISVLWYDSWHQSIYAMIRPSDITMFLYHSHVISRISWYVSLYHGTCAAGWRGLGPQLGGASLQAVHLLLPRHRQRAGESVGTVDQLNGDGLDPVQCAWTCCSRRCQVSSLRWKFSSWT